MNAAIALRRIPKIGVTLILLFKLPNRFLMNAAIALRRIPKIGVTLILLFKLPNNC